MTTLAKDTPRSYGQGVNNSFPVIAADIIFEGAAVGENGSGYSRPLVAGDVFQGFALRQADNSAGAAGALDVTVIGEGFAILSISALAITANDQPPVYASDDNTFTLTAGSNSLIGNVVRWMSTGIALVKFSTGQKAATVDLADLATGIKPSHILVFGGQETTTGGSASEAHTITGVVAATDFVVITIVDDGTNSVTVVQAVLTNNTLTVTFSGDPAGDTIYNYAVYRAAA